MSSEAEGVILETQKLYLIQNILEKHQIGRMIAKKKLGNEPNFMVIEKIEKTYISGRNGILLLTIKFNSEMGGFTGVVAYKEFSTSEEVEYNVLLNKWIEDRVKHNSKVRIPEIYSKGENFILYEGVEGEVFDSSPFALLKKANIAGEILATYHSSQTPPADLKRYSTLLTKTLKELPISKDRKGKLLSLGYSLLANYNYLKSGVYGYGDFQPDNVMIAPDGQYGYLIDPEFVESKISADRFEDISNFFVFSAIKEFKETNNIKETLLALRTFLRAYNTNLKLQGTSLEQIYAEDDILGVLLFHLGLTGFIHGASTSRSLKSVPKIINSTELEELMLLYKFTKFVWTKGIKYLPEKAFPVENRERIDNRGWAMTWVAIGKSLFESLQSDSQFKLLYNIPKSQKNVKVDDALRHWGMNNKNELEDTIKELNLLFDGSIVDIKKNELIYNKKLMKELDLTQYRDNWEEITINLKIVFLKKPENYIINEIVKRKMVDEKELEELGVFDKKKIKFTVKQLIKKGILFKLEKAITLAPEWYKRIKTPVIVYS
ncbi:MAG: hypothetical protein HeimC3_21590 [Candidatus Heimdallarchaeota archaeon LC_3]|nr:MAG: hypothetical protein HeimC3_21590 [Candidatus Heimdallarchaeota archaeon LC_3]